MRTGEKEDMARAIYYQQRNASDEHPVMVFGFITLLLCGAAFFIGYNTALNDLQVQAYADSQGKDIYQIHKERQGF